MTTKQAVWDSNELSIDAALSAVDQWESAYTAFRSLLVHTVVSARGIYGTAKDGVNQLEHGLLIPVRDWILLPAFTGAEKAVAETNKFLHSPAARHLAHNTLQLASSVPVIGENILAPTMKLSVVAVQRTWDVLQYPIPSREQVRSTVDWSLTGTKWALTAAGREIFLYAKRADANITRTLSHTQWKVLGSGPYTTLDASNRSFVIDHSCERYLAQTTDVARYEFAAHVRRHNPALYFDLVVTGLLKERGGDITEHDEWLSPHPVYRDQVWEDVIPFLIPPLSSNETSSSSLSMEKSHRSTTSTGSSSTKKRGRRRDTKEEEEVSALWFRWPHVNGSPPAKDAPWICFRRTEQYSLECKYQEIIQHRTVTTTPTTTSDTLRNDDDETDTNHNRREHHWNSTATPKQTNRVLPGMGKKERPSPPTIAQWYRTNPSTDVMVDQQRYSVVFSLCCPKCRKVYDEVDSLSPTLTPSTPQYGDVCASCQSTNPNDKLATTSSFVLPPISTVMRPNFWRFYGNGDDVRRATWFLDTARHGLQPFDYDAQAVLEDAYLFLKWLAYRRTIDPDKKCISSENGVVEAGLDESLLTVDVPGPDGTDRLVQFSSLTQATAIQKGLGAAMALFKRRVYRGAWLESMEPGNDADVVDEQINHSPLDDSNNHEDILPEMIVPDESLRSLLIPPAPIIKTNSSTSLDKNITVENESPEDSCLAVPRERMKGSDMIKLLRDERDGSIDHLCLIVHGIGEMMRSVDLFGLTLPNLSAVCGSMRSNHAEAQAEHLPQIYPKADAFSSSSSSAAIGRVEYLPVEWHEAFSILTQRRSPLPDLMDRNSVRKTGAESSRNVMIEDISLKTIPNMREFANDTLMDVLFFMNPEHHQIIVDVVTNEMNLGTCNHVPCYQVFPKIHKILPTPCFVCNAVLKVVEKFRKVTGFTGRISVIGHSLGSVISWDVLNHQYSNSSLSATASRGNHPKLDGTNDSTGNYSPSNESDYSKTPELTPNACNVVTAAICQSPDRQSKYPQLNFAVDNFFLLGSPVPVFLMIRNQRKPLSSDFSLRGCRRVFNIFHPYDPVAYRLEGCIDPRNAYFEPALIRHWNGGFRVQYRTRRIWRKIVATTSQTQRTVVEAFEQSMAGAFGIGRDDDDSASEASAGKNHFNKVITGNLNEGHRIDYMLQEKEIENANEYVAALAAHSSYWIEKDLSLFIARQIYLSALEYAAEFEDVPVDFGATWDIVTPEQHKM